MKQTSLGHYTATSNGIRELKWAYYVGGDHIDAELPGHDRWNRDQELTIECTIDADLDIIYQETHTDARTPLGWVIVARSDAQKVIASTPIMVRRGRQRIALSVLGTEVGGRVRAELALGVIGNVADPIDRFAPHLLGHLVFTQLDRIQLEGSGGQLPLLPISFKEQGVMPSDSGWWWLRINHVELDAPASSALWLWLNSDNPEISVLLESSTDQQQQMLATFMAVDFSRQLLNLALTVDDLDLNADYPESSLGVTLAGIVRLIGETLPQVRLAYQTDPGAVEARLQAVVAAAARSTS